jgi:hypothetical protein
MARKSLRPMNRMFLMENGSSPCQYTMVVYHIRIQKIYFLSEARTRSRIETKVPFSVFATSRICASDSNFHTFPFS